MNQTQHDNLLRYIAEEMAHHKFGEMAVEFDVSTQEHKFTSTSNIWINYEIENLREVCKHYDCKPKINLIKRIKLWLKKR